MDPVVNTKRNIPSTSVERKAVKLTGSKAVKPVKDKAIKPKEDK